MSVGDWSRFLMHYPNHKKLVLVAYVDYFENENKPLNLNKLVDGYLAKVIQTYPDLYEQRGSEESPSKQLLYKYVKQLAQEGMLVSMGEGKRREYQPTSRAIAIVKRFREDVLQGIEERLVRNVLWRVRLENLQSPRSLARKFYRFRLHYQAEKKVRSRRLEFSCVTDEDLFKQHVCREENEFTWLIPAPEILDVLDSKAFAVRDVKIFCGDCLREVPCTEVERNRKGKQRLTYVYDAEGLMAHCSHAQDKRLRVGYEIDTLVAIKGSYFFIEIPWPTSAFRLELDYSQTDIDYVEVKEFFHVEVPCKITYSKGRLELSTDPSRIIAPGRGLTVVWYR